MKDKAVYVLKDVENQFNILNSISLNISIKHIYRPSYFKQNKYYEIELLEDFTQYNYHSSICNEYFLFYPGSDNIFHSSGFTKLLIPYIQNLGLADTATSIQEKLNSCETFEILFFNNPEITFVLYPVNIIGEAKATICFVIYNNNLRSRIQSVVAGFADNYTLYFENHVLVSDNNYKQLSKKIEPLEVYSNNRS